MKELSKVNTRYRQNPANRIMQGDIFEDVPIPLWDIDTDADQIVVDPENTDTLSFAIVVSQDCDLDQDYNNWKRRKRKLTLSQDKILPSVLVCVAYPSKQLLEGKHRGSDVMMVNWKEQKKSGDIDHNNYARFHFLEESTARDKKNGLRIPSLIIDFKHYQALPISAVYKLYESKHYIGSINELFREELSQRFSSYLGRVGTPPLKDCPPCGEEETSNAVN
jgi:hypothetical protein